MKLMKNRNYDTPEQYSTNIDGHEINRRTFAKRLGAGAVIAMLGIGYSRKDPETAFAQSEQMADVIQDLESNTDAYDSNEAVDPNVFNGKSDEEQADIIAIHQRMKDDKVFSKEMTDKIGLLFNSGLTAENTKEVWEEYGSLDAFLPHNTNAYFARLKNEMFGPDHHSALIESGVMDIADINQTLESISKFKMQIDAKFLDGVMQHHTADTITTVELKEYESSDDEPVSNDSDGILRMNAIFTNTTLDSNGDALSSTEYEVDMAFERYFDESESRTITLPRGFAFNER
jgi:hypothetical protein